MTVQERDGHASEPRVPVDNAEGRLGRSNVDIEPSPSGLCDGGLEARKHPRRHVEYSPSELGGFARGGTILASSHVGWARSDAARATNATGATTATKDAGASAGALPSVERGEGLARCRDGHKLHHPDHRRPHRDVSHQGGDAGKVISKRAVSTGVDSEVAVRLRETPG